MTKTVVIPMDIQKGFSHQCWGPRNNPNFEAHVEKALTAARDAGLSIWHVRHLSLSTGAPLSPGQSGADFAPYAAPIEGERIYEKHVNSGFIGTTLEADLRAESVEHIVLFGMTSDHCVSTTARMAANIGFKVTLLGDAIATHDRFDLDGNRIEAALVHQVSLASLNGEFARVMSTQGFVDQISRSSNDAHA